MNYPMSTLSTSKPIDEMLADPIGDSAPTDYLSARARTHYQVIREWLRSQPVDTLRARHEEAELLFRRVGITFAVYGDDGGIERTIPFDIVPRVFPASDWAMLERGLVQRVQALNRFLHDVYHDQHILKAGVIPAEQVLTNSQYRPEMQGFNVPLDVYAHIAGVDIVRAQHGAEEGTFMSSRTTFVCLRRVLHDRKPQNDDSVVSRAFCEPANRARGALSGSFARQP